MLPQSRGGELAARTVKTETPLNHDHPDGHHVHYRRGNRRGVEVLVVAIPARVAPRPLKAVHQRTQ